MKLNNKHHSPREPLPEKLEAIAKDFLRDWRNLDTRSEADHLLSELDGAQRSAVIRRAQRLCEEK
jgi:hypothetical protein